jgi:hypothetical protein
LSIAAVRELPAATIEAAGKRVEKFGGFWSVKFLQ